MSESAICQCGHPADLHRPKTFMAFDPKLGKRRKYHYQDCGYSVTTEDGDTRTTEFCFCGTLRLE